MKDDYFPKINPLYVMGDNNPNRFAYAEIASNALRQIISERMGMDSDYFREGPALFREKFLSLMPVVTTTKCSEVPGTMSIYALSKMWTGAFRFVFDMVFGWLIPGKRINLGIVYALDFSIPEIGEDLYTLSEIVVCVENNKELELILSNLPSLETEIQMGLVSSHYAKRILEVKGFSNDIKTVLIQEQISYLVEHRPKFFDQDMVSEMQHVLLLCREDFKTARECRHLSRIIGVQYLFRKGLLEWVKKFPEKRHIDLKLFRARIIEGDGSKSVVAIVMGVNFIRDKEMLDKSHVMSAVRKCVPNAKPIENSFFINRRGTESVCTMYLEIEKVNREAFTSAEIKKLRKELPGDLKNRIKHLLHPVFMPRNEEEIIRNILSLSGQIKYLRDIPQVFISFDEQTHSNVFFTVILVRVARPENLSIQEMFKNADTCLEYIHDRCQNAGTLRKKYKKEATVFRVKLAKEQYLRTDHAIDLNKARQTVVDELFNIVGEIRDFNGGMISKQIEVLTEVKSQLGQDVKYSELLLEDFFYSVTPVIMRSVLDPSTLTKLFLMLLNSLDSDFKEDEETDLQVISDEQFVFAVVKADDRGIKEELHRAIGKLQLHSSQLASSFAVVNDLAYVGYIYRSDDAERQEDFVRVLRQALLNRKKSLVY